MLSFQKACRSHFSLKIQLHYYYFLDFSSLFEFIVVIFPACSRKCENKHKMKKIVSIQSEISIEFFLAAIFRLLFLQLRALTISFILTLKIIQQFLTYHIIILIASNTHVFVQSSVCVTEKRSFEVKETSWRLSFRIFYTQSNIYGQIIFMIMLIG